MAVVDALATVALTVVIPPFLIVLVTVLVLASLGKSLGLRQKYVQFLLKVFEDGNRILVKKFGRQRLSKNYGKASGDEQEEEEEEDQVSREVICRDKLVLRPTLDKDNNEGLDTHEFELGDCLDYIRTGMEAIVDDEVTKRFSAEELTSWNFLTRTNCQYEFISVRLTIFWVVGFILRYFLLLPLRIIILLIGTMHMVTSTLLIGLFPDGAVKRKLCRFIFITSFRIISRAFSGVITYHNKHNMPRSDGICVANHTTPVDCVVLACDNGYSYVGQRHGGFLGIFQRALSRASAHIWFERSESKDRFAVARRLREHVEDPEKLPILIFPEGTCINNTSVMQFKKGTFEVGGIIYPVAIKYDPRFGDAFWNSSKESMLSYIYMMMTSWAIVCDVWYLPPMTRREGESSIDFANRVKAEIARQGGLVDLVWDGGLKRSAPKIEWKQQYQQEFSRRLKVQNVNAEKKEEKIE
ncbi:glycerol-3-phosphate acyltransferase 3-like isoform X1 [Portunus trituberculatus]|uniref:glycerol-3-phosphate acyltransferase 3-like isoform X1 n=1 Tax=Portunus trituberculatus TaxID=210409 RepID=UPI001E1D1CD1|nr:glycerol-3-phosphate acyltransferase 3-like isoform X1 [Portunus trituberculatus]